MTQKNESACKNCGVIVYFDYFDREHEYSCPRCKSVLYRPGQNFIFSISMAISSLMFFIAANFLEFLSLNIAGITHSVSVIDALLDLGFYSGITSSSAYIVTAIAVFTGIVIPVLLLILMLSMAVPLQLGYPNRHLKVIYSNYNTLKYWAMADVYVLAVFVSLIKLFGLGEVVIGEGLLMFVLFLISFYSAFVWFNPHDIWLMYELDNRY